MSNLTSKSLLFRLRTGTDDAWAEFAQTYEKIIRHWLRQSQMQEADVEDVLQETLVFVHQAIGQFEHNGRAGAFRNWLRRITANRIRELLRKAKRNATAEVNLGQIADQLADDNSDASRRWDIEHDRHLLEHFLGQLTNRLQASSLSAFRKVVLEGRPAEEVAHELGMSLGAVRVAQSRVRRALRKLAQGLLDSFGR